MIHLEKLKQSTYFEILELRKGDILFSEWESDEYLYIVYDGELRIEKNTSSQIGPKHLALLGIWNIIGEWSLSSTWPKEVSAVAHRNSQILRIPWKAIFSTLLENNREVAVELIQAIIETTNNRLLRSNKQIATNYEILTAINHITSLDTKSVFWLIDRFSSMMLCDGVLYLEKNPAIEKYLEYKYDSRHPWKLQDIVIEWEKKDIHEEYLKKIPDLPLSDFSIMEELSIGKVVYGYLIVTRKRKIFEDNEKQILASMANSFVWVMRQKKILDDEKNKKYMKSA